MVYWIIYNFLDMSVVSALLIAFLVIDGAYHVYLFVMWILRKIPMIGVS